MSKLRLTEGTKWLCFLQRAELGSYQQWPEPEHPVQLLTLPEWRAASHGAGVPVVGRPWDWASSRKHLAVTTQSMSFGSYPLEDWARAPRAWAPSLLVAGLGYPCVRRGPGQCAGITGTPAQGRSLAGETQEEA